MGHEKSCSVARATIRGLIFRWGSSHDEENATRERESVVKAIGVQDADRETQGAVSKGGESFSEEREV